MVELLSSQDVFLGFESAIEEIGITVSYWRDEASILAWKSNLEHREAQRLSKELIVRAVQEQSSKGREGLQIIVSTSL